MEVAGQWRREWAGTAEYGKVTEGGVTRQVARAMEVLHASAPGAKVRVLRAAYHSTAGPGAPASSYLLHSSRRVISSGYNFIEPDTMPSKPLEISSTPFESLPETEVEKENYKVTEPDDFEISEPSKWIGSKNKNSIRMPSEESSSTDNTSVIDVSSNNTSRKIIEKFTPQYGNKRTSPISSLLDAPVTLSTLKYKSLLNGDDSWNNRRKSYSFEETPEINEPVLRGSNGLTMESSTDSGICKSNEIVNDNYDSRFIEMKNKMDDIHEETFKDWLSKNRQTSYRNQVKINKEEVIDVERVHESNITLQSTGKVSITLPTSTRTASDYDIQQSRVSDDIDRRTKKVEFCKTELHFAAESGTVNIIATDEKPPPSNDFRKKRSVFVPMSDFKRTDKSITLFGDSDVKNVINEVKAFEENTAATKSILKNKIPKPKPYLLGENMVLGDSIDLTSKSDISNNIPKPTAVSLINRQLQPEKRFSNELRSNICGETDWSSMQRSTTGTCKLGPANTMKSNQNTEEKYPSNLQTENDLVINTIKSKIKMYQMSPTPERAKTRQLRESDLTYFGVNKPEQYQNEKRKHSLDSIFNENNLKDEILHSVQLVRSVSNSLCSSEIDSDEAPDYENLPMKHNFAPKPAPRSRSKYQSHLERKDSRELNPIMERDVETMTVEFRRDRLKKQVVTPTSRSISEPPKANRQKLMEGISKSPHKINQVKSPSQSRSSTDTIERKQTNKICNDKSPTRKKPVSPLYVNIHVKDKKNTTDENVHGPNRQLSIQRKRGEKKCYQTKEGLSRTKANDNDHMRSSKAGNGQIVTVNQIDSEKRRTGEQQLEKKNYNGFTRTKILTTPEKSPSKSSETSHKKQRNLDRNISRERNIKSPSTPPLRQPHQTRSSNRDIEAHVHKPVKNANHKQLIISDAEIKDLDGSTLKTDAKTFKNHKSSHKSSVDKSSTKEPLKGRLDSHKKGNGEVTMHNRTLESPVDKTEKNDNIQNKSRRSKYVINYDDKNGTVSSVRKIPSGHGSSRKKKIMEYETKENLKENSHKTNIISNKSNLLQFPEEPRMNIQR